jgi:hypothetical protein
MSTEYQQAMSDSQEEARPQLQFFIGNLCKTLRREVIYDALKKLVYVQRLDLPKALPNGAKYKPGDQNRGYAVVSCKHFRDAKKMIKRGSIVIAGDRAIVKPIDMVKKNAHWENRRTRHSTRVASPVNSSSSGFDFAKFAENFSPSRHDSGVNCASPLSNATPAPEQQMQRLQDQLPTPLEDEIARRRKIAGMQQADTTVLGQQLNDSNKQLPMHENNDQNVNARAYINALNDYCIQAWADYLRIYCEYVTAFTALQAKCTSNQQFVGHVGQFLQGSFNIDESAYKKEITLLYNCC